MSRLTTLFASVLLVSVALFAGCQGQTSTDPPIVPIRNMHEQPRYDPQERSAYFRDHRTMRPQVGDTFAREQELDAAIDTGLDDQAQYVLSIPEPVIARWGGIRGLLERGEGRYTIYCTPCHGGLGDGRGMVPRVSSAIQPSTFHDERLRHAPDGQIFATISNGVRNMPSYRGQIPVTDRWAIVAYVRALQLTQVGGQGSQR